MHEGFHGRDGRHTSLSKPFSEHKGNPRTELVGAAALVHLDA